MSESRIERIGDAILYQGDCYTLTLPRAGAVITDPPYPNNAGHFDDDVPTARKVLQMNLADEWLVFWSELERPPVLLPLCGVHIWHRTNVNGRPYEPVYHFNANGEKRRSEVYQQAAIFDGAGPGCNEYAGHPTQKPCALMEKLILKTTGLVLDPFMGSGSTGIACATLGRAFIGIEREPKYFDIACERITAAYAQGRLFA
jgi:site-specific DNA-methyltransferase (adenine-specific)